MSGGRAAVVALSNSEQQRETLVIMLDEAYDVAAAANAGARPRWPAPSAVVVAHAPWNGDVARQARRRWPHAGLVLVDAPAAVAADLDGAAASWSDPYSVPAAVARVAAARRAEPEGVALARAVQRAELALRPLLEQTRNLAALALAASRPTSVDVATRFLAEHVANLLDRFAWTDWFDAAAAGDEAADLAAALHQAVDERRQRARARGLDFDWDLDAPLFLACSAARAETLARCLRLVLLDLPPGTVSIRSHATGLRLLHQALDDDAERGFPAAVVAALLRRAGARLRRSRGSWTIEVEGENALDHA